VIAFTVRTSLEKIMVTGKQDGFIKAQVELGESKTDALRAALLEGEQSGEAKQVDPAEFKRRMAERAAQVNCLS
jgi:Arc/MetJ-type ribon-helix-helix transcriptional regulator